MSEYDDTYYPAAFPVSSEALRMTAAAIEELPERHQQAAADRVGDIARGMSLRDYFAAKIVQGLCANSGGPFQSNPMNGWGYVNCDSAHIAHTAYTLADAMLNVRAASETAKGDAK